MKRLLSSRTLLFYRLVTLSLFMFMADKELTFWDHLDELRRVLFRIFGCMVCVGCGLFHCDALSV